MDVGAAPAARQLRPGPGPLAARGAQHHHSHGPELTGQSVDQQGDDPLNCQAALSQSFEAIALFPRFMFTLTAAMAWAICCLELLDVAVAATMTL